MTVYEKIQKEKRIRKVKIIKKIIEYISTILVVGSFFIVLGIVGALEIGTATPVTYIFIPVSIIGFIIGTLGFKFLEWVDQ